MKKVLIAKNINHENKYEDLTSVIVGNENLEKFLEAINKFEEFMILLIGEWDEHYKEVEEVSYGFYYGDGSPMRAKINLGVSTTTAKEWLEYWIKTDNEYPYFGKQAEIAKEYIKYFK